MRAARGRTIAFTDADLAYSPDQLTTVIAEVEAGWDVAVGSRRHPDSVTVRDAGVLRDLGGRVVNLLAMGVLLSHPHDTQCGLKALRADVARTVFGLGRVDGFAFDIELLHLVERHGFSVVEVPVRLTMGERSTVRLVRDTLAAAARPLAHPPLVGHRRLRAGPTDRVRAGHGVVESEPTPGGRSDRGSPVG